MSVEREGTLKVEPCTVLLLAFGGSKKKQQIDWGGRKKITGGCGVGSWKWMKNVFQEEGHDQLCKVHFRKSRPGYWTNFLFVEN